MDNDTKSELERAISEKRSLPDCTKRKELEKRIIHLQKVLKREASYNPEVLVRYAGKVIGKVVYDSGEASWMYKCHDGSQTEVGFSYEEVRSWASIAGYRLKVVQ